MATCKDCVHFDVCCSYLSTAYNKCKLATPDFKLLKNIECDECQYFKDRSRFVELPCVGDKVYELCRINQFGDYKIVESEIRGFIVDTNGTAFDYELLGERFFLTHEEAEQALKEREKDE